MLCSAGSASSSSCLRPKSQRAFRRHARPRPARAPRPIPPRAMDSLGGLEGRSMSRTMSQRPDLDELSEAPSGGDTSWAELSPDEVVELRAGDVLIKDTILKSDHFPGCQNLKLTPLIDGAPNFRQVPGLPVYGVAIPTVKGLRTVLDVLGAGRGGRKVLWHNMREEPVIYINGQPFVVRESNNPLANLEYTGIDRARVEQMEDRLKADILREAEVMHNTILVADEDNNFNVVNKWESVTEVDVQTPLEVYAELQADGYDVDYFRVPVTDEKAPKERDCDELVRRCWNPAPGAAVVFNCQMGRGRTTTGMIIGSVLLLERLKRSADGQEHLPQWFLSPANCQQMLLPSSPEEEVKAGMYDAVRSLLRVLEDGSAAKLRLDTVIDACSSMQNLREAIGVYRGRMLREKTEAKRDHLLNVLLEYLERYYVLIAFTEYVSGKQFAPKTPRHKTFLAWYQERPELQSILDRMLRRNPFAALGVKQLHSDSLRKTTSGLQSALKAELVAGEGEETTKMTMHIAGRSGSVLGAHTILKLDHWTGMHDNRIPQVVEGAPNFRGVSGAGVYAVALPTRDGIRGVLENIGAAPTSANPCTAVWHNMREEPLVYINGRPYVLRESARPFKNMQEYTGIDAQRLELMEMRLKEDVLTEARRHQNSMLLSHEAMEESGSSVALVHQWEEITEESVKVPSEIYQDLCKEGFRVHYWRVPVTDGTTPEETELDTFAANLSAAGSRCPMVFNCQLGLGRSTFGVVAGCLLKMEALGLHLGQILGDDALATGSPTAQTLDEEFNNSLPDKDEVMDELPPEAGPSELETTGRTREDDAMLNGDYVLIRRLVRTLVQGEDAKELSDRIIGTCSKPINMRTQIMKYLKRHHVRQYQRHDDLRGGNDYGYKRATAYLDRYWLIIAFSSYILQRMAAKGVPTAPLSPAPAAGVSPRPTVAMKPVDLSLTFEDWYKSQPELKEMRHVLSVNPAAALELVLPRPQPPQSALKTVVGDASHVPLEEQRMVLDYRAGATLHLNTILKSYSNPGSRKRIGQVQGLPVMTIGTPSVDGLQGLLDELGCAPGGNTLAVITDITEELRVYIKGKPYVRRELEMPVAALHHAGISYSKLQEMEVALVQDVVHEAELWGGRLLLHKELEKSKLARSSKTNMNRLRSQAGRGSLSEDPSTEIVAKPSPAAWKPAGTPALPGGAVGPAQEEDEVTRVFDKDPGEAVVAMWESGIDTEKNTPDHGIATTKQVFIHLRKMGYRVEYKRIPLSRDRTPIASDIDHMQLQLKCKNPGGRVVHLIMSRSKTGSSCRYVTGLLATALSATDLDVPDSGDMGPLGSSPKRFKSSQGLIPAQGEHRNILNLLRVLEFGPDAKQAVDAAIGRCADIGDLRTDIAECWMAANNPETTLEAANETRQLGLHYLQRYGLLIMFRVYLQVNTDPEVTFSMWKQGRPELGHLMKSMKLY